MKEYSWPNGAKAVIFLSVNFDAESYDLKETTPDRLYGRYTYGRYGIRAGFPRLVDLLEKHQVPATFFVPASDARRHPDLVRTLAAKGHEIAARGVDMEDFATLGEDELRVLKESRAILADIAGKAPVGFRAPTGEISSRTLAHLAAQGFIYDATFQDADFPYTMETGSGTTIVEVPASYGLEDAQLYSARHTHERLLAVFRDEVSAMHDCGTLIPITLHLRGDIGSSRGARIGVLDSLLTEIKAYKDVQFMTGEAVAAHTTSLGMKAEPDPMAAHLPALSTAIYRGDLAVKPRH